MPRGFAVNSVLLLDQIEADTRAIGEHATTGFTVDGLGPWTPDEAGWIYALVQLGATALAPTVDFVLQEEILGVFTNIAGTAITQLAGGAMPRSALVRWHARDRTAGVDFVRGLVTVGAADAEIAVSIFGHSAGGSLVGTGAEGELVQASAVGRLDGPKRGGGLAFLPPLEA